MKLGIEYRWPSDYNNTHLSRDILCFFVFARLNKFRFGEVSTALPDVTDHVSSVSASQIQYHYVYVSFKRLPAEKKNVKNKKKGEKKRETGTLTRISYRHLCLIKKPILVSVVRFAV